jgi:ubiquinone/menaquinone biosynthesis C-methylase UbiE
MKELISTYFRARRFSFFKGILDKLTATGQKVKILDIGGTEDYWNSMGLNLGNNIEIVLLNLYKIEVKGAGFSSIKGDACNLEGIEDKSFDLVFSNSVIEHLFTKENQQKMANEVIRVGKNYFIQTPNKYFLIEPHWVFPLFQFLPFSLKVYLTQHFNLGHISKSTTKELAINQVNEIKLISKKELRHLFKHSEIYTEYFLGLSKSHTAYYLSKPSN